MLHRAPGTVSLQVYRVFTDIQGLYRYGSLHTGSLQVYTLQIYWVFTGKQGLYRYTGSLQVNRVFTGIQGLCR